MSSGMTGGFETPAIQSMFSSSPRVLTCVKES